MITLHPGRLTIETDRGIVRITRKQAHIFLALASRPNRTVTYETLIKSMYANEADAPENPMDTIKVHICLLRKHLRSIGDTKAIQTVHTLGYTLTEPVTIGETAA